MQDDDPDELDGSEGCEGSCAFSFYKTTIRPPADLEALEWNPCMDCLACLTAAPDSTLSVYRLSPCAEEPSLRVLSEKISAGCGAVAWSPCGRKVCVGDRQGCIIMYDGESGAVLHSKRAHSGAIVAMSWVAARQLAESAGEAPLSQMLPPLLQVPTASNAIHSEMPEEKFEPFNTLHGDSFTLLASLDDSGHMIISAGGTFPLQSVRVFGGEMALGSDAVPAVKGLEAQGPRVIHGVLLSPDIRQVAILLGSCTTASDPAPSTPSGASPPAVRSPQAADSPLSPEASTSVQKQQENADEAARQAVKAADCAVLMLDIRQLAVRRKEIQVVASSMERLWGVTSYVQQAIDTLGQVWKGPSENLGKKIQALNDSMAGFADSGTGSMSMHRELLVTACTGSPTDAVHAFLNGPTSPQQLMRMQRDLTNALEYVSFVICTRLQVAAQHTLTILQDMHGCASWAAHYESLGLQTTPLQRLAAATQDLLLLSEVLLLEAASAKRLLRTLFQVLLRSAQRLTDGEQPLNAAAQAVALSQEDVEDFMHRMQRGEPLDLENLSVRIGTRKSASIPPPPMQCQGAAGPGSAPSLHVAASRICKAAQQLGTDVAEAMSSKVKLLALVPIHAPPPWICATRPDLRPSVASRTATSAAGPGAFVAATLTARWEALAGGARLLLLWSGAPPGSDPAAAPAELHCGRLRISPAPLSATPKLELEVARCRTQSLPGSIRAAGRAHFMLCQLYDVGHATALVVMEDADGAEAAVCQLDLAALEFHPSSGLDARLPAAQLLESLPEGMVLWSEPLKEVCNVTAMRGVASRRLCSIYAWRKCCIYTLDMDPDEDEDEAFDDAG